MDVQLGDHVRLVGYSSPGVVSAGDALTITLFWQSDGEMTGDYHVFVHLLDADGHMAAQHDGVPVRGERPTWDWRDREALRDEHVLAINSDLVARRYALSVGMYDHLTKIRLPALGSEGQQLDDDRVSLGQVVIRR